MTYVLGHEHEACAVLWQVDENSSIDDRRYGESRTLPNEIFTVFAEGHGRESRTPRTTLSTQEAENENKNNLPMEADIKFSASVIRERVELINNKKQGHMMLALTCRTGTNRGTTYIMHLKHIKGLGRSPKYSLGRVIEQETSRGILILAFKRQPTVFVACIRNSEW